MTPPDVRPVRPGLPPVALWLLTAAVSALLATAVPVRAQAPGPSDSIPRYDLDSLVVSVLGAPTRVGRSAYPVSVAGRQDLREGKTGMFLEEALQGLPGVQVQNRFNYAVGERVIIRGFGSRSQFGVRGIHVVVDGIPATLPDGQSTLDHVDIGSLGRVEAMRGPASALYGNASGGVLRFETEIPSGVPIRQEATVVGGSHGLLRLQSSTTGTVGETGYRVNINRMAFDGYRTIPTATALGPAGTSYGRAERLHANARLEQAFAGGRLGFTMNHMDLDAENPGSIRLDSLRANPHGIFVPAYIPNGTRKEVQQTQFGFTWNGPVGGLTAEAAAYGLTRDFLNPLPGDVVDVDRRSGGARLMLGGATAGDGFTLDLRGGLDADVQNDDRREYSNNAGNPGTLRQNQTETVKSLGLFLTTTVALQDRVSLLGGLRYDASRFEVQDLFPAAPTNPDDSGQRDMNSFSPTVGVHVEVTPEIGVYANYATSYETPTTVELGNREDGSGGFNPDLDPQTGRTFEGGVRGTVRDRVSYEVGVFNTRLENELIPFENASLRTFYRNAGASTRKGVEAVVWVRLHDLARVQGSYSYTKARFEEYVLRTGENLAGKRVPGVAPQQLQGSVRVGPSQWYVEFGAEYTDEIPVNDTNAAEFAESYTLFGVRVGGNALRVGRLEVSPFAGVQNLTDETYVSSVAVNAFGSRFYEPGPGRTFYLGGTVAISR